ncbi:MAG TPA: response regulator [Nitrospira sp.]|jgi:two-component system response regulator (stage 0 sporulation protein F)|nr:response regulator [Nitrospira sp.]
MAKILVIDDERPIRSLLRAALEGDDHQVLEAANGRLGLELYREWSADLIITDLVMPEMSGLDLISELTKSARVKIIAMTGDADATNRLTTARLLGARQILRKPFDLPTLLSMVRYELAQ